MARVLGAARLSHDTDESTSIARQGEQIVNLSKARGDVLVHITEDTDVSGAVAPFDRDGLGPWLAEPLASQWDVLMVTKLDRLTRSLRDFDDFRVWCDEHGKTIVSLSESLDLSTSIGRMFANLLAMFAQFERERMGERRADAAQKARREGKYDGRTVYFGYKPVNGRYVKDGVYSAAAEEMAQDRLNGRTYSWIARKLNAAGIMPNGGGVKWDAGKVQKRLQNPSLNGIITFSQVEKRDANGKVVKRSDLKILRGADGRVVKFTDDPIVNDADWVKLQEAVKAKPQGQRLGGFMLTRSAYCDCGQLLYGNRRPGNRQSYYRCATGVGGTGDWCGARTIPSAVLEADVESKILARWGGRELHKRTVRPPVDHRAEIETLEQQIADVEREFRARSYPAARAGRMLTALEADLEQLRALPVEPGGEEWEPSGITLAMHWASLDADARGHLLRSMGVRVMAKRDETGEIHAVVSLGTPEGFEQASGLLLQHTPGDHEPWYEVNGMWFTRADDGTLTEVRPSGMSMGMVRDYVRLQAVEPDHLGQGRANWCRR